MISSTSLELLCDEEELLAASISPSDNGFTELSGDDEDVRTENAS